MPFRQLDQFVVERGDVLKKDSLKLLAGANVGIDAVQWLRQIVRLPKYSGLLREPYLVATGGSSLTLAQVIEAELANFKAANITPVMVFNGINQLRKDTPFSSPIYKERIQVLEKAWEAYAAGNFDLAMSSFAQKGVSPDMINSSILILHSQNVDVVRAPYACTAQLGYMNNEFVNAIYGNADLFVYRVQRVITNFDFEKMEFDWLDRQAFMTGLNITDDELIDICLLAGYEYLPTYQPIHKKFGFQFRNCVDVVLEYKNVNEIVKQYGDDGNYLENFMGAVTAIKSHPILNKQSNVVPILLVNNAVNLEDVMGKKLPDVIMFYLAQGLISPQVFNNLISGLIVETPPLCGGDSAEYRTHLRSLLSLRTDTLSLLTSILHPDFQHRQVFTKYWFDVNITDPMRFNPAKLPKDFHLSRAFLDAANDAVDFCSCFKIALKLGDRAFDSVSVPLKSINQIISATLMKCLLMRTYSYEMV